MAPLTLPWSEFHSFEVIHRSSRLQMPSFNAFVRPLPTSSWLPYAAAQSMCLRHV